MKKMITDEEIKISQLELILAIRGYLLDYASGLKYCNLFFQN